MALPIDSTVVHADNASRLAEAMSLFKLDTANKVRARTRRSNIVHLLIHTCDRRDRSPRYGVMPSGCSGCAEPWGSCAAYGGSNGNIDLPDRENGMVKEPGKIMTVSLTTSAEIRRMQIKSLL